MSAEPSMEEILSSIKRIIAEEGEGPARARRAPRAAAAPAAPAPAARPAATYFDDEDEAEVLELSDPMPAIDDAAVEEDVTMPQSHAEIQPIAAALRQSAPNAAPHASAPPADPIVSDRAAEASRSSLDSLTRLVSQADVAAEKGEGASLEAVVRSMLRPMLREWLDANLPAIVETMVAGEIARITGQGQGQGR